ncbi:hypothetical protein EJ08DRAFT_738504 [Tothia fuscella]|uniref:Uncharacterized protein n=1 Tax=Tothia fuscella TaxID=1048955 RepID=A0A9P4TSN0_9PEZI|nr:hypothetical protein EJ08DRAFT_738504 [Tothia fuscella]
MYISVVLSLLILSSFATAATCNAPYTPATEYIIPNSYMVNFTLPYTIHEHFKFLGKEFDHTPFSTGYGATFPDSGLLDLIRSDCKVNLVVDNVSGLSPEDDDSSNVDSSQSSRTRTRRGMQKKAQWPLIQLSAADKVFLDTPPADETYYYVDNPGLVVDIYILDSGVNHIGNDFKDESNRDRLVNEANFSDKHDSYDDDAANAGDGTRVASVIGGN